MRIRLLMLFLLLGTLLGAQVSRSTNIIVQKGEKFYLHEVQEGETVFAISKAYGVSVEEILKLNYRESVDLAIEEILKIPHGRESIVKQPSIASGQVHVVKEKETLYSISRHYGVTIDALKQLNPDLGDTLKKGYALKIPQAVSGQKLTTVAKTPRVDRNYYYHIVRKKETLYSISKEYDYKLRKLKKENDLKSNEIKEGDEVKIPIKYATRAIDELNREKVREANQAKIDSLASVASEVDTVETPVSVFPQTYSTQHKDVYCIAILLPIEQNKTLLSYYQGMLKALESSEVKVKVLTFDTRKSASRVREILSKPEMKEVDLIIGPYSSEVFEAGVPYAEKLGVPIISLSWSNEEVHQYESVVQLNTTSKTVNKAIADYVLQNHEADNVIYFDGGAYKKYTSMALSFEDKMNELGGLLDNALAQKVDYNFRKDYLAVFRNLLNPRGKNLVIVPELEAKRINQILTALSTFNLSRDISVIGYPHWKFFTNRIIDPELLYSLNVSYFTPFSCEEKLVDSEFEKSYLNTYVTWPDDFSCMGYETMETILEGLKLKGLYFYMDTTPINGMKFRKRPNGGYENTQLKRVNYTPAFKVEVLVD